jgi:hypothetical protein
MSELRQDGQKIQCQWYNVSIRKFNVFKTYFKNYVLGSEINFKNNLYRTIVCHFILYSTNHL